MPAETTKVSRSQKARGRGQIKSSIHGEGGYSLPLVIAIALAIITGAAAIASRGGSLFMGSASQKQSLEARSLAEFGMATLVSRLNKEENRYLLAAPRKEIAPSYRRTALWGTAAMNPTQLQEFARANHTNPCGDTYEPDGTTGLTIKQSKPPSIADIFPDGKRDPSTNNWWYVTSTGRVSSSPANAVGRFRLTDKNGASDFQMGIVQEKDDDGNIIEEINYTKPNGKSTIKLSIEAETLNANGSPTARVVLEEVLDLVPKCCKTTFGGAHGNNIYTAVNTSGTSPLGNGQCLPPFNQDSFGVVFGVGGTGGEWDATGGAVRVYKNDPNETPINPVVCIDPSPTQDQCIMNGTFNGETDRNKLLEILNARIPPAPEWYPDALNPPSPASNQLPYQDLAICRRPYGQFGVGDCSYVPESESATTTIFRYCIDEDCRRTVINGNATTALPPFCKRAPAPPHGDNALHCVVKGLDTGNGSKRMQFVTGILPSGSTTPITKPIRLYFPAASTTSRTDLLDQGGNTAVEHCVTATDDPSSKSLRCRGDLTGSNYKKVVTQLSMFGCNPSSNYLDPNFNYYGVPCGPQTITLKGNASTLSYFSYFPNGTIDAIGSAEVEGVVWAKNILTQGSVDVVVPESGIAEVFELLGVNAGDNGRCEKSIFGYCKDEWILKWDFIARSTRRFTFKNG